MVPESPRRHLLWIAVFVLQAWYLVGTAPFSVIEGDGATIAFDAFRLEEEGPTVRGEAYRYDMQSGTYAAIRLLSRMTGQDPFAAFSLLTAVAALAFLALGSRLVSKVTGLAWPACWLLMLLFQEVWTSAYYPNSSTPAVAALFLGLLVLTGASNWPRLVFGGGILGLAAWLRFDTVVIAPVVPFLLAPAPLRTTASRTILAAAVAAAVTLSTTALSGTSILAILDAFAGHREGFGSLALTTRSYVSYFSLLSLAMILVGVVHYLKKKSWRLLGMTLTGCGLMPLLLGTTLTTPKYLLYLVPFFTILATGAIFFWQDMRSPTWRRVLGATACCLFLVQYVLGVQLSYRQGYHPRPRPTLLPLASLPIDSASIDRVSLVLGAGSTISTHDSIRLSSGLWAVGPMWRHFKRETAAVDNAIVTYLDAFPDETLGIAVVEPWDSLQLVQRTLYREGYRPLWDESYRDGGEIVRAWTRRGQKVKIYCGEADLARAQDRLGTRRMLVYRMWDGTIHETMRTQFPNARCLAGGPGTGHSAYLIARPESPPQPDKPPAGSSIHAP